MLGDGISGILGENDLVINTTFVNFHAISIYSEAMLCLNTPSNNF